MHQSPQIVAAMPTTPATPSSGYDRNAWGIVLAIVSAIISNLGTNAQKRSHLMEEELPTPEQRVYWKRPFWWIGMMGVVGGAIGDFVALGMATQSLVTAVGGSTVLVANIFIARFWNDEDLYGADVWGVVFVVLGAVLFAINSPEPRNYSLHKLEAQFMRPNFIVYVTFEVAMMALGLSMVRSSKLRRWRVRLIERFVSSTELARICLDRTLDRQELRMTKPVSFAPRHRRVAGSVDYRRASSQHLSFSSASFSFDDAGEITPFDPSLFNTPGNPKVRTRGGSAGSAGSGGSSPQDPVLDAAAAGGPDGGLDGMPKPLAAGMPRPPHPPPPPFLPRESSAGSAPPAVNRKRAPSDDFDVSGADAEDAGDMRALVRQGRNAASQIEDEGTLDHWSAQYLYAACAGTVGALSVLLAACASILVQEAIEGHSNPVASWPFWLFVMGMLGTIILQTDLLNQAMILGDTMSVFPVFQAFWIGLSTIGGAVFYQLEWAKNVIGVLFLIFGVMLLCQHGRLAYRAEQNRIRLDQLGATVDAVEAKIAAEYSDMSPSQDGRSSGGNAYAYGDEWTTGANGKTTLKQNLLAGLPNIKSSDSASNRAELTKSELSDYQML